MYKESKGSLQRQTVSDLVLVVLDDKLGEGLLMMRGLLDVGMDIYMLTVRQNCSQSSDSSSEILCQ